MWGRLAVYGAAAIQNTEAYRPEYCPDCHLAQISLRKDAGEHVLHCDGSLKGLAIPRVWAKKLSCKLLSTTDTFVLYISLCLSTTPSHVRTLCRTSVVWLVSSHVPLPGSWIYATNSFKNKFKALNNLLNNKKKSIFVSVPKNLAWTQQQVASM